MSSQSDRAAVTKNLGEIAVHVFSTYFPDEVKGPITKEIEVACPFHPNNRHSMYIWQFGAYNCSRHMDNGDPATFIATLDFVNRENVDDHIAELKGKVIPKMNEVDSWAAQPSDMKNLLTTNYGLEEKTLDDMKVGYNPESDELVFPVLNGTGRGLVGAKFIKLDATGTITNTRYVGKPSLYGLYEMREAKSKDIFLVKDEFDVLTLMQRGYTAVSLFRGNESWWRGLGRAFKKSNVRLCLSELKLSAADKLSILVDLLEHDAYVKDIESEWNKSMVEFFFRDGKNKAAFDSIVDNLEPTPPAQKGYFEMLSEHITTNQAVCDLNLPQDYVNGKMFFAVKVNNFEGMLDSDREFRPVVSMRKSGEYRIKEGFPRELGFSAVGISQFSMSTRKVDPLKLYSEIREHVQKYVFLRDDNLYSVLTLWIIGTYVYRVFDTFPYLHVSAQKGSGKTRLLEVMSDLSFNSGGKIFVNETPKTVFWEVDTNSSTLFFDEVEKLRGHNKEELIGILNSGYRKGARVPRSSGKTIIEYDTYSPKMFAGINDISETLSDRSIELRMLKKLRTEKISNYQRTVLANTLTRFRDDLYIFALTHASDIVKNYLPKIDELPFLDGLENRARERWAPLLILADMSGDTKVVDEAKAYAKQDIYLHKLYDSGDDKALAVIAGLRDLLIDLKPAKVEGNIKCYIKDDVFNFLASRPDLQKKLKSKNELTKLLGQNGISDDVKNIRGKGSKRCYLIDPKVVSELVVRYEIES